MANLNIEVIQKGRRGKKIKFEDPKLDEGIIQTFTC